METTLRDLMANGIEYDPHLGVWIDPQGTIYSLKNKDIADMVEFETVEGTEYEHYSALQSLTDVKHGS